MKSVLERYPNLAQNVIENAANAVLITDNKAKIIYVNDSFTKMTGYETSDVIGKKPSIFSTDLHNEDFYEKLFDDVLADGHFRGEIQDKRKNGEPYTAYTIISVVTNEYGNITNYVAFARDISKQKEKEKEIHSLAFYDSLTGLANRRLFEDHLHEALSRAKRHEQKVAVIFMDMDNFKNINDTFGHHVGDQFLQEVARRIANTIRDEDTLSRIGGDEFTLLLEEISGLEDAAHAAERIIEQIRKPFEIGTDKFSSAISLGISIYPDDSEDFNKLLTYADKAMYHVKNSGKNNFEFYNSTMNQKAMERLQLEHDLSYALHNNQLELYYQCKTNLETMKISSAEALVRWRRPNHGLMSPAGFVHIAEQSKLIIEIGSWVLHEACAQTKRLLDLGHPISIAVNVSPKQFNDENFVSLVSYVLDKSGLDGKYLELEFTESAILKDIDLVIKKVEEISKLGVKFSIDDFGIGYSSMNSLKQLRIDKLKIDGSFIHDIDKNAENRDITAAIISLAHNLNLEVIAEEVETEEEVEVLKGLGCNFVQGFLFSIPTTIDKLEEKLKNNF